MGEMQRATIAADTYRKYFEIILSKPEGRRDWGRNMGKGRVRARELRHSKEVDLGVS